MIKRLLYDLLKHDQNSFYISNSSAISVMSVCLSPVCVILSDYHAMNHDQCEEFIISHCNLHTSMNLHIPNIL